MWLNPVQPMGSTSPDIFDSVGPAAGSVCFYDMGEFRNNSVFSKGQVIDVNLGLNPFG